MPQLPKINIHDFRNYKYKTFEFDEGLTLVVGNNGAGKTNLLEAIRLLSTGKSFRAQKETVMIRNGEQFTRINGRLITEDTEETEGTEVEVVMTIGVDMPKKRYLVNGVGKRRSDFVGRLRTVLFRPEDLEIILGSPSIRREFMDLILEQADEEYRRSLLSYKKGLRQRNKVLERIRDDHVDRSQLAFWDNLLIKNGDVVRAKREELIEFINGAFGRERISEIIGGLKMEYGASVISPARLEKYKQAEVAAGMTLVGPHRDDFVIVTKARSTKHEARNLAIYGSRGEQRLAVLALKLAELSFVTSKVGERPLLLLDDIFSELDHEHREDVLKVVGQQQTVMTTTDLHLVDNRYRKKIKLIKI